MRVGSWSRRGLAQIVVVALAAAGTVVAAAAPSLAVTTSQLNGFVRATVGGGNCGPSDNDQSDPVPPGATTFNEERSADNCPGFKANARQNTRIVQGDNYATVQSTGSLRVEGDREERGPCCPRANADNDLSISVSSDDLLAFRVQGSIKTRGTGLRNGGVATGCASIGASDIDGKSACQPPTQEDPASVTFGGFGESSSFGLTLNSGFAVGVQPEGGQGFASMEWSLTVTLVRAGEQEIECGEPIIENIVLAEDLDCTGHGLIAAFPGITINLGGHTIRGDAGSEDVGVANFDGHSNVTVTSGTVESFGSGLLVQGGQQNTLKNILVSNSVGPGVELFSTKDNLVRNITARQNGDGFFLAATSDHRLIENFADDNAFNGFLLGDSEIGPANSNRLLANRSDNNDGDGIKVVGGSFDNRIRENKVNLNQGSGISLNLSGGAINEEDPDESIPGNKIIDNRVNDNGIFGIGLEFSDLNTLRGNRIRGKSHAAGIDLRNSDRNEIESNIARQAAFAGYNLVAESDFNTVKGNTALESNIDGSDVVDGDGFVIGGSRNDLIANFAKDNFGDGFKVANGDLNALLGNTSRSNDVSGFLVDSPATNTILRNNVSSSNSQFGFVALNDTTTGANNEGTSNAQGLCIDATPSQSVCQQIT